MTLIVSFVSLVEFTVVLEENSSQFHLNTEVDNKVADEFQYYN